MDEGTDKQPYLPEGKPADALTLDDAILRLWNRSGGLAVNLGSGNNPRDGWVNVDVRPDATGVNVVCDLFRDEWPFPDDSVGMLYSEHFLEHVPPDSWPHVWNQAWRVLKDGAHMVSLTPYCWSDRYMQDATHVQAIHQNKWAYLSKEWRELNNVHHDAFVEDMNFIMDIDPWFIWNEDFKFATVERQRYALKHYINVVDDIVLFTCAAKSADTIQSLIDRFGTTL